MNVLSAFQPLTTERIRRTLCTRQCGRHLHLVEQTESTNTLAFTLAQAGAVDGTAVIAEAQTAGRGRLGRLWHSPAGQNLYCSVVLRGTPPAECMARWLSWIPLLSALAVARAIHAITGLSAVVKWPNDVLLNGRKVAGILCESTGREDSFVIVGVGVNVNARQDSFPLELRDTATSLAIEAGRPFDRAALAATLFAELEIRRDTLLRGEIDDIRREYDVRCATLGQHVRVERPDRDTIEGIAEAITADGALHVRLDGAQPGSPASEIIRAGDVFHLRPIRASSES